MKPSSVITHSFVGATTVIHFTLQSKKQIRDFNWKFLQFLVSRLPHASATRNWRTGQSYAIPRSPDRMKLKRGQIKFFNFFRILSGFPLVFRSSTTKNRHVSLDRYKWNRPEVQIFHYTTTLLKTYWVLGIIFIFKIWCLHLAGKAVGISDNVSSTI